MERNRFTVLALWLLIPLLVLLSRTAADGEVQRKLPLVPMDAGEMTEMGQPILSRDVKVKFQGKDPWILASSDTDFTNPINPLVVPSPKVADIGGDGKEGIEDMLNMKVIRFMTDKPHSTASPTEPPIALRAMRAKRSGDVAEGEALTGTAPPEVTLPDTIKRTKEKYEAEQLLERLANEKTRQAKPRSPSIQGGNAGKRVVDFNEAIRVTVPYGDERSE